MGSYHGISVTVVVPNDYSFLEFIYKMIIQYLYSVRENSADESNGSKVESNQQVSTLESNKSNLNQTGRLGQIERR